MRKIRLLAVVVAVLLRCAPLHGGDILVGRRRAADATMDRGALLTALEQRARTGVPRHLDHDDGEELQAALTAALAHDPNDLELATAATRASIAINTEVNPPITDGNSPSASIDVYPRLSLPWRIKVTGTIEASLDGSAWRKFTDLSEPPTGVGMGLDRIFHKDATRPGFHAVRFRALLRYSGQPDGVPPTESRTLPPATYAVRGPSGAGLKAASFLATGMHANVFDLDHALPGIALDQWLRTLVSGGATPDDPAPPVVWSTQWCDVRTASEDVPSSVCARAMMGAAPGGGHAEIWVKVAEVDLSTPKPTWTAVTPELVGVDLHDGVARATTSLPELPFALRASSREWPHATLVVDASAITLTPANARPGQPVAVRARLRNSGTSDLTGMTVDVLVFDTPDRVLLHRRFVRSIHAGESIEIEANTAFPLGYGGVFVSVMPLTDHTVFDPLMTGDSDGFSHAARLVHPELAPRGFTQAVRASIGCRTPACPNVR